MKNSAEPPDDLTSVQREILETIQRLSRLRRRPPSMRELLPHVKLSSVGALSYEYGLLEAKGYLRREAGRPRTVEARLPGESAFPAEAGEPVRAGQPRQVPMVAAPQAGQALQDVGPGVVWVPVEGRVAAGEPIPPLEPVNTRFPLPREVVGGGTLFMLRVVGDSMIGAGIVDGDWVVVREQRQAENGEIVAALINGTEVEGTVKTLKLVDGHRWLMPQNPVYTPILGDKAEIRGKVVAVLRRV